MSDFLKKNFINNDLYFNKFFINKNNNLGEFFTIFKNGFYDFSFNSNIFIKNNKLLVNYVIDNTNLITVD